MKVTQPDSRSIRIVSDTAVRLSVPYHFFWNGHERPAESIALDPLKGSPGEYEVRAFFLFGEIRDRIREDSAGIVLSRTWSVKTPGTVHLSIDLELEPASDPAWFFPGVHSSSGIPARPLSLLGDRTAYPSSIFVGLGRKSFLLFSPSASCGGQSGSIGISRTVVEDEPSRPHLEIRFPGIEKPTGRIGPKPRDVEPAEEDFIESPGSLERSHQACLVFSTREEIAVRGAAAVVHRIGTPGGRRTSTAAGGRERADALRDTVRLVLDRHLVRAGGVAGLREIPDSPWISASAGLGCALALRALMPDDPRMIELGLQLADFALKGQVPWGPFYESFHVPSGRWRGVRGTSDRTLLSVGQSARIADLLLVLSEDLASRGMPHEKYFLAGLRFVDFFLDEKGRLAQPGGLHAPSAGPPQAEANPGLPGMELFFPMARVFARTGRDRYKKALDLLVRRFSALAWDPFRPPATREDRGSDSAAALLAVGLFLRMRALGYKPAEPPVTGAAAARAKAAESARLFSSLLVPWIRIHDEPAGPPAAAAVPEAGEAPGRSAGSPTRYRSGFLLDSFVRQRLLCAGNETALLLLRLAALTPDPAEKRLLTSLARGCLASSASVSIGTGFIQHTRWDESASVPGGRKTGRPPDGKKRPAKAGPAAGEVRVGPIDSRRAASEVLSALDLQREFPGF
jgi:hypothetical protein